MPAERFRWQYQAHEVAIEHHLFDGHEPTDFRVYCYLDPAIKEPFMVWHSTERGWVPYRARDAKGYKTEGAAKARAIKLYLSARGSP